jgi:hypothetical protein
VELSAPLPPLQQVIIYPPLLTLRGLHPYLISPFLFISTGLLHYVTRSYILSLRTAKSDLEKIEAGTADLPKVEVGWQPPQHVCLPSLTN